jgi:hypothetical protein
MQSDVQKAILRAFPSGRPDVPTADSWDRALPFDRLEEILSQIRARGIQVDAVLTREQDDRHHVLYVPVGDAPTFSELLRLRRAGKERASPAHTALVYLVAYLSRLAPVWFSVWKSLGEKGALLEVASPDGWDECSTHQEVRSVLAAFDLRELNAEEIDEPLPWFAQTQQAGEAVPTIRECLFFFP